MRPRPPHPPHHAPRARAGFTLIELLIVLGIIGLLVSITLVVGGQVMNSGKKTLTTDTIRVLDTSLEAYLKANETNPDPWVPLSDLHRAGPPTDLSVRFPAADARNVGSGAGSNLMINSLGVYLVQASKVPGAKSALSGLPTKLVTQLDEYGQPGTTATTVLSVVDAWGKPIRYVHPAFQGMIAGDVNSTNPQPTQGRATDQVLGSLANAVPSGQTYGVTTLRRNHTQATQNPPTPDGWADSDGGTCVGGRPYFYSAGPDGLVGFIQATANDAPIDCNKDNVYTIQPTRPTK